MVKYNEILRLHQQGLSLRAIASSTRHSRQIVTSVIERAKVGDFSLDADKTDAELHRLLFPEKTPENKGRMVPDFETVHAELAKSGVTLSLLWEEYRIRCASENKLPYSYRQFCRDYSSYAEKTKATLRIKRKPGEIMEVDWAGQVPIW